MSDYERKKDIFSSLKIKPLYHITHIDNLESILKYGILSRGYAERNKIFFEILKNLFI